MLSSTITNVVFADIEFDQGPVGVVFISTVLAYWYVGTYVHFGMNAAHSIAPYSPRGAPHKSAVVSVIFSVNAFLRFKDMKFIAE